MNKLIGWLTNIGKVLELLGTLVAAILGIAATMHGTPLDTGGKIAITSAFLAGLGHAVTHQVNAKTTP